MNKECPACGGQAIRPVLEIPGIPALCNLLCASPKEALSVPRGDMRLGHCAGCGHLFNTAFDPGLVRYSPQYFNALDGSALFRSYAQRLAADLAERHSLRGRLVVEIGCGRGEFLKLLCQAAGARGLGIDPGYEGPGEEGPVRFEAWPWSASDTREADLVCCRQTLEHLAEPAAFLPALRPAPLFIEVPNAAYLLRHGAVWDLIYEHCSYFSAGSLGRLFARCGYRVDRMREAFGGQYLAGEATAGSGEWSEGGGKDDLASFAQRYQAKVAQWRDRLRRWERVVVWGAGSKGVTFVNTLAGDGAIEYVVDVHPRKQGKYIAGAGQKIVPPEFLRSYRPRSIVVMNPIYEEEIRQQVADLGVRADVLCA